MLRTANARVALADFTAAAESTFETRDWAAASRNLGPVCAYLRLFDGHSIRSSLVLLATRRREQKFAAMELQTRFEGVACTASVEEFSLLVEAVLKRIYGPTGRNVRVLLL